MATITYLLQSKNETANIYVRLSVNRKNVFKRKSGFVINPKDWSKTTNLPKPNDEELKKLKTDLGNLKTEIEKRLNNATANKIEITGDWLQEQIDSILGKKKKTDVDRLTNYIQIYSDKLSYKVFSGGKTGVVQNTFQKYTTLKNKITAFEKHKGKKFYVKDVGLKFSNDLAKYFFEVDKLSRNSAGRYLKYLKTVCRDAKNNGIETHPQMDQIKGFAEPGSKIFLTFDELEAIENTTFEREALKNAKDWLIIGCFIGQRVSDLLILTSDNIKVRNGLEMIELTQKKTGKRVAIPLHPKVKEVLARNEGNFPDKISDQKFNKHIKDICKLAKIDEPVSGGKMIKDEKSKLSRKQKGIYPKHELITTHVCRRSFATNFYGEIPTALLKTITGHSTEQQFLEYIGKNQNDYAIQIAEFWNKQQQQAKKEPQMTVLKQAN